MKFKLLITFSICFLQLMAFGQKLKTLKDRTVKITESDSIFYISISSEGLVNKKIKNDQRYYWFRKGELHSNIGHYEGELLHGEFKVFDENNNLIVKGWFDKGLKANQWFFWDDKGNYLKKEDWKDGQLCGSVRIYDDKVLISKSEYRNGQKSGVETLYSREGNPIESKKYKKGLLHGTSKNWKTKEVKKYKQGKYVSVKEGKEKELNKEVKKEDSKANKIKTFFRQLISRENTEEVGL